MEWMNQKNTEQTLLQLFAEGEAAPAEAAPQPQEAPAAPPDPAEAYAHRQTALWHSQAERAKEIYPRLDLSAEIRDPRFARLLRSGVDVETAYAVVHSDEILTAAMHHAARVARQQLTAAIRSGTVRPAENGVSGPGGSGGLQSVAHMTRQQRDNIRRRAARGEKIHF